eukprot:403339608
MSSNQQSADSNDTTDQPQFTKEDEELCVLLLRKKDYYDILTLEKTANDEQIKKSYRKLALKLHPDKNRAPKATDAFKKLSQAFACLSDPEKRKNYDLYGSEEQYRSHFSQQDFFKDDFNPDQIFKMFFGGMNPGGMGPGFHFSTGHIDMNDLIGGFMNAQMQQAQSRQGARMFRGPGGSSFTFTTSFGGMGGPQRRRTQQQNHRDQIDEDDDHDHSNCGGHHGHSHSHGHTHQRTRGPVQQEREQSIFERITSMMKKVFWLAVLYYWFFYDGSSSSKTTKPNYNLFKTQTHKHELRTSKLKIPYYVDDNYLSMKQTDPTKISNYDSQIEKEVYENTYNTCEKQKRTRQQIQNDLNTAYGDQIQQHQKRLDTLDLSSCSKVEKYDEYRRSYDGRFD